MTVSIKSWVAGELSGPVDNATLRVTVTDDELGIEATFYRKGHAGWYGITLGHEMRVNAQAERRLDGLVGAHPALGAPGMLAAVGMKPASKKPVDPMTAYFSSQRCHVANCLNKATHQQGSNLVCNTHIDQGRADEAFALND